MTSDWSPAYIEAQKRVEQSQGSLVVTSLDRRTINTWVRAAMSQNKAPDPAAIYFALFETLPPQNAHKIRGANSVVSFIEGVREEKGLQKLTQKESDQIQLLAVEVFRCCEALQKHNSTPVKSGCVGLILVLGIVGMGALYGVHLMIG